MARRGRKKKVVGPKYGAAPEMRKLALERMNEHFKELLETGVMFRFTYVRDEIKIDGKAVPIKVQPIRGAMAYLTQTSDLDDIEEHVSPGMERATSEEIERMSEAPTTEGAAREDIAGESPFWAIWAHETTWKRMPPHEQKKWMDNALMQCRADYNKEERLVIKKRPYDFQGFAVVMALHGPIGSNEEQFIEAVKPHIPQLSIDTKKLGEQSASKNGSGHKADAWQPGTPESDKAGEKAREEIAGKKKRYQEAQEKASGEALAGAVN